MKPREFDPSTGAACAVMVGGRLAGFLESADAGWCFRAASRRFAALDCARFSRREDAQCAARGVIALEVAGCPCRARMGRAA
jgi:hypothetical protein